jgi:hypothetical protein
MKRKVYLKHILNYETGAGGKGGLGEGGGRKAEGGEEEGGEGYETALAFNQ